MRPNILLISADQHRADCLGFMGRKVKTPHLDELAADGTHFSACITPTVVCQPARGFDFDWAALPDAWGA